jgi:hypothetical protein
MSVEVDSDIVTERLERTGRLKRGWPSVLWAVFKY